MATSELKAALQALVQSAGDEFFATTEPISGYRYSAPGQMDSSVNVTYASVIGYSGDQVKGSMVISCERELLDKSHPNHAMGMPVGDPEIIDWIGEIANQMLGRIKNKLSSAGVKFAMGTPTTVTGKSMQITPPKDCFALSLVYKGPMKDFQIYLLTVIEPSVTLKAVESSAATTASEGASILF